MEEHKERIALAGLDPFETEALLSQKGIDSGYALRLLYWVYRRRIHSFEEINDIPKRVLDKLRSHFVSGITNPVASVSSSDTSVKYLFVNGDGLPVETVYLPDKKRHTVCVSVQSGCRMGCRFCATGLSGWRGNLAAGEIVGQVISLPHEVTHVVMMGMGEPGDNPDEVIKACRILTAQWGLSLGKNKVTVSTVGLTPFVKRLLEETECNITLSLHSPFTSERAITIPAEKRWPVKASVDLISSFRSRRGRRFTAAYVMIRGVNDTDRHLEGLTGLFSGKGIRINLIPFHPATGDRNVSSDHETMLRFKHLLVKSGIGASVRRSRGQDIRAACGMLAGTCLSDQL